MTEPHVHINRNRLCIWDLPLSGYHRGPRSRISWFRYRLDVTHVLGMQRLPEIPKIQMPKA